MMDDFPGLPAAIILIQTISLWSEPLEPQETSPESKCSMRIWAFSSDERKQSHASPGGMAGCSPAKPISYCRSLDIGFVLAKPLWRTSRLCCPNLADSVIHHRQVIRGSQWDATDTGGRAVTGEILTGSSTVSLSSDLVAHIASQSIGQTGTHA